MPRMTLDEVIDDDAKAAEPMLGPDSPVKATPGTAACSGLTIEAPALLEQAAANPTLDEMMRRDPRLLSAELRVLMVENFREKRAIYIKAEDERKAKRS